jgi:hypothetical protein
VRQTDLPVRPGLRLRFGLRLLARIATIAALSAAALLATAFSWTAATPLYSAAATRTCLENRPGSIAGLPPANPPVPPAHFVYSFPRDHMPSHARGELGIWYGKGAAGYEGIRISFFKNVRDARASGKSLVRLYGGKLLGNVAVSWDQSTVPKPSLQQIVLGCLRAKATPVPRHPTPRASLATFAGSWGGHTRGLSITPDGRGAETTDDGCCTRVYEMSYEILSVRGTVTHATAAFRVTSYTRSAPEAPAVQVGQTGSLVLRNGIVTNTLTKVYFCSTPAWGATGACGA